MSSDAGNLVGYCSVLCTKLSDFSRKTKVLVRVISKHSGYFKALSVWYSHVAMLTTVCRRHRLSQQSLPVTTLVALGISSKWTRHQRHRQQNQQRKDVIMVSSMHFHFTPRSGLVHRAPKRAPSNLWW